MGKLIGIVCLCLIAGVWANSLLSQSEIAPARLEQNAFQIINENRLDNGIPPLEWDSELANLAREYSQHMEETGDFRHSDMPYAENILEGVHLCDVANCIYELWAGSQEHYLIMMDDGLSCGAIGISGDYATFLAK